MRRIGLLYLKLNHTNLISELNRIEYIYTIQIYVNCETVDVKPIIILQTTQSCGKQDHKTLDAVDSYDYSC